MMIPEEEIMSKIYLIRGVKDMLDRDIAKLYEVETRILNQAVKRNEKRFPEDFMFQMSKEEMEDWKSQIVMSNKEKMGLRKPPLVFLERIEKKEIEHDQHIILIFEYLRQLEQSRQQQDDQANRKRIGFRKNDQA